MPNVEAHVASALCGAFVALIVPPLFEGGPVPLATALTKLRGVATAWRRGRSITPLFWSGMALLALGGLCTQAGDPFTVKLQRQQIPLHSLGGVVYHKSAYYGSIFVGGPHPQKFDVVFDTGSGHLVLPSTMCHSATCRQHRRYRRRNSATAKDIDYDGTVVDPMQARDQITVAFGTGEVTGVFVEDSVCLNQVMKQPQSSAMGVPPTASMLQTKVQKLTSTAVVSEGNSSLAGGIEPSQGCVRLRIVAATDMTSEPFSSFDFDGVLGLGLQGLSQTPEFNFFHTATQAGAWDTPNSRTFTVFLGKEGEESDITFGGWQESHFADGHPKELAWCDVKDPELGYWQLPIHSIRIGDEVLAFCEEGCHAVVDTGTSLLGVPSAIAPQLRNGLQHAIQPGGSCDGTGPQLHIDLGNFTVTLGPQDYARPQIREELELSNNTGEASCIPMMMLIDLPAPLGPKLFILGEPVLQRYYTGFDSQNKRVGFAVAKHMSMGATPLVTV